MSLKINFINAEELLKGIAVLADDLDIEVSDNADVTVKCEKCNENKLKVEYKDKEATITYGRKVDFYRAMMILCMK